MGMFRRCRLAHTAAFDHLRIRDLIGITFDAGYLVRRNVLCGGYLLDGLSRPYLGSYLGHRQVQSLRKLLPERVVIA